MHESMTCGEATMRLLEKYGVTTLFGIPGVHTLDFCRGLHRGIRHVQSRNEQGAGFMAEGWARATGKPGVALVISGPGVTNASTALGQCWADSLPMLLLSAEPDSHTIGRGWGVLHEITEQKKVTEPLTAFSATAHRADEVPDLIARAFCLFASERPRPVHISIPTDVQAETVTREWQPVGLPARPGPLDSALKDAAELLLGSRRPVIMVGGGAREAGAELTAIAERLEAVVVASTAGKGIVPDDHPLSLSASTVRPEVLRFLGEADVILAVGTELSETDSFVERMDLVGRIIRVDIDPSKMNDFYESAVSIVSDARPAMASLLQRIPADTRRVANGTRDVIAGIRREIDTNLSATERQHVEVLQVLAESAPEDTVWSGDACQLVYTGAFAMPVRSPRKWFYPAGYCSLGNALPNAIGAKLAKPETPVVVLAGDGGFMFTMPELMTASELGLTLPIVIWENGGLKQIQDDMDSRNIGRVGVEGPNPDFVALARACHCRGVVARDKEALGRELRQALEDRGPTVIVYREQL